MQALTMNVSSALFWVDEVVEALLNQEGLPIKDSAIFFTLLFVPEGYSLCTRTGEKEAASLFFVQAEWVVCPACRAILGHLVCELLQYRLRSLRPAHVIWFAARCITLFDLALLTKRYLALLDSQNVENCERGTAGNCPLLYTET